MIRLKIYISIDSIFMYLLIFCYIEIKQENLTKGRLYYYLFYTTFPSFWIVKILHFSFLGLVRSLFQNENHFVSSYVDPSAFDHQS